MARKISKKGTSTATIPKEKPQKKTNIFGLFDKKKPSKEIEQEEVIKQEKPVPKKPKTKPNVHAKPSKKDVSKAYSQKRFEQNVFMYMPPAYFGQTQKYYNEEFKGVTVLGTNNIDLLSSEFQTKTLCNAILLFIFNQNDVKPLHKFLSSIGFRDLDRRILTVFIAVKENVNIDLILDDHEISDFISVTNEPIKIDATHPLSYTVLDRVMSGIVQNQPVYMDEEVKAFSPQQSVKRESSISSVYKVDFDALKSQVDTIKDKMYTRADKVKVINALSATAKSDNKKRVTSVISSLPHIQAINDAEEKVDNYLSEFGTTPHLKDEIRELVESKFLLEAYKTEEIKAIIDDIIDRVDVKLKERSLKLTTINRDAINELNAMKSDAKEMIQKRKEIMEILSAGYSEFEALTVLAVGSMNAKTKYITESKNVINKLVQDHADILPTETITTMAKQSKMMTLEVRDIEGDKEKDNAELSRVISLSSDLIKNYNLVIKHDTILIDKLCSIIDYQDDIISSQEKVILAASEEVPFSNKGKCILNIQGSGLDRIFNLILEPRDFVLYISDKEQSISDNEIDVKAFISKTWSPTEKQVVYINNTDYSQYWKNKDNIEHVINKLDYASKYFDNIYIIFTVTDSTSNLVINKLFLSILTKLGSLIYGIKADLKQAAVVNMIHHKLLQQIDEDSLHAIITLVNRVGADYIKGSLKADISSTLGFRTRYLSIPERKDIENGVLDTKQTVKLKTIKDLIK